MIMEKMLEAAQSGLATSEAVNIDIQDSDVGLQVANSVHILTCSASLRERVLRPAHASHRRRTSQFDAAFLREEASLSSSSSSNQSPTLSAIRSSSTTLDRWETFAEIKLDNLQYNAESRHDKFVTKVAATRLSVSTPQHADSPFPNLVAPLGNHKAATPYALLVRVESYKPPTPSQPKPPSMTWVELHGVQICWVYFTIAKVQLFFTGNEEAAEFDADAVRQFMSKYKFSEQQAASMNWSLLMTSSELLVVETAETPECAPMELVEGTMSRRGVGPEEIHYEFNGQASFFSKMWDHERQQFDRESLTLPFLMKVLYIHRKSAATNTWNTDMSLDIKDLDVSMSRKQLILMQNILDNQMADIRDVSTLRSQQQQEQENKATLKSSALHPPSPAKNERSAAPAPAPKGSLAPSSSAKVLQNSFTITVKKMKLNLRQGKDVFAQVSLSDFLYATESWTHLWTMLIEADYISILSTHDQEERPYFATILQPRSDFSGSSTNFGSSGSGSSSSSSTPRSGKKRERSNSGRLATPGRLRTGSIADQQPPLSGRRTPRQRIPSVHQSPILSQSGGSSTSSSVPPSEASGSRLIRLRLDRRTTPADSGRETHSFMRKSSSESDFSRLGRRKEKAPADEDRLPWSSRWLIDVAPLQIVYSPGTYQKMQDFFALLEEHKNLRRRYQQIQSELSRIYQDQDWLPSGLATIPNSPPKQDNGDAGIVRLCLQM